MVKRLNKNHYLANPNETSVNSHGSIGHSLINTDYHRGSNHRGYSTDGKLLCCHYRSAIRVGFPSENLLEMKFMFGCNILVT